MQTKSPVKERVDGYGTVGACGDMEKGLPSQAMDRHFVLKTREATTGVCGDLNENGPHRLIGNDTFRSCGPVGVV